MHNRRLAVNNRALDSGMVSIFNPTRPLTHLINVPSNQKTMEKGQEKDCPFSLLNLAFLLSFTQHHRQALLPRRNITKAGGDGGIRLAKETLPNHLHRYGKKIPEDAHPVRGVRQLLDDRPRYQSGRELAV